LKVGLETARHIDVDDQPDVVLVHPHPKGVRGGDDSDVAADKGVLALTAQVGVEPGMVVLGGKPEGGELVGDFFRAIPTAAEHDRGALPKVLLQQVGHRLDAVGRGHLFHLIRQIDSGGAPIDEVHLMSAELLRMLDDLAGGVGLGGRGE